MDREENLQFLRFILLKKILILIFLSSGKRIRGRPRKRWIVDIEEDVQIMGIRRWRSNVKKEQNGRKSLRRLKPIVGCNASESRERFISSKSALLLCSLQ
jgi:hypothetical protein